MSDTNNNRIQKFNQNLEFIYLLELEYRPLEITVFNTELVVRSSNSIAYFYDINSLNFNRKSNDLFELFNLSEIDSMFYKVKYKEVYFYDQNGNFRKYSV